MTCSLLAPDRRSCWSRRASMRQCRKTTGEIQAPRAFESRRGHHIDVVGLFRSGFSTRRGGSRNHAGGLRDRIRLERGFVAGRGSYPLLIIVDSTRRNSWIAWQKRAAMWEHGFESRWGHHLNYKQLHRISFRPLPSPREYTPAVPKRSSHHLLVSRRIAVSSESLPGGRD